MKPIVRDIKDMPAEVLDMLHASLKGDKLDCVAREIQRRKEKKNG